MAVSSLKPLISCVRERTDARPQKQARAVMMFMLLFNFKLVFFRFKRVAMQWRSNTATSTPSFFVLASRNALHRTNERLLKLLSDVVKQAASTEETINKKLEDLIQETSQTEEQLTQFPLESGTLHESQFPNDSVRRPESSFPAGLPTSTPAAGPSALAASHRTPTAGGNIVVKLRKKFRFFRIVFFTLRNEE